MEENLEGVKRGNLTKNKNETNKSINKKILTTLKLFTKNPYFVKYLLTILTSIYFKANVVHKTSKMIKEMK